MDSRPPSGGDRQAVQICTCRGCSVSISESVPGGRQEAFCVRSAKEVT